MQMVNHPRTTIDRRRFLAGFAAAAAAAEIGVSALPSSARAQAAEPGETAWRELAVRLSGPLLRPGDKGFTGLSQPNNLRYSSIIPAGIARCRTAEDVRRAILWARETGTPLVVRSGGHSYAGFSTTSGLMIDLSLMRETQVDPSSGIAHIGGGARNAHLYHALRRAGASITHGRCLGVGAAGFLLGGGIGFNMRAHGLGCDQLIETEIVTADGNVLTVNNENNPDLFWACRGIGGGNLGIHTAFKVQGFAVHDMCAFQIVWTTQPDHIAAALLEALAVAPERLGSKVTLEAANSGLRSASGNVAVRLLGQLHGSSDELTDILAPVYRVAPPTSEKIEMMTYWAAQDVLSEEGKPAYYQERSRFLTHHEASALLPPLFEELRRFPGTSRGGEVKFFQTGGQINAIAGDATAFVHRNSDWLFSVELNWDAVDTDDALERAIEWQSKLYEMVASRTSGGAYQNFADPSLSNPQEAYYGSNLKRLQTIKAKYDPDFVFRFAQAVAP